MLCDVAFVVLLPLLYRVKWLEENQHAGLLVGMSSRVSRRQNQRCRSLPWLLDKVPVYKGGSRNVATNYRPISLTSQLCKVFETIIRDQVIEFLETNALIRNSQHGFRKGRSCLTNLLLFRIRFYMVLMTGFR